MLAGRTRNTCLLGSEIGKFVLDQFGPVVAEVDIRDAENVIDDLLIHLFGKSDTSRCSPFALTRRFSRRFGRVGFRFEFGGSWGGGRFGHGYSNRDVSDNEAAESAHNQLTD
jgi:hypothetical protein